MNGKDDMMDKVSIKDKREYIVNSQRWMAYNVFGYMKKRNGGSFVNAYNKILSRVYLDYDIKIGSDKSKTLDSMTNGEIDMMYNSTKKLMDMYNKQKNM